MGNKSEAELKIIDILETLRKTRPAQDWTFEEFEIKSRKLYPYSPIDVKKISLWNKLVDKYRIRLTFYKMKETK